jgi:polysaccharide biosynthesis transport protein
LRRRKWLILGAGLGAALTALVLTLAQKPNYTATAVLHVATRSSLASDQVRPDDVTYVDRLENTYAELATSRSLLDELTTRAGLPDRPGVDVESVPNTELMNIKVTTQDRQSAAVAANLLAGMLIARVRALTVANRGPERELVTEIRGVEAELKDNRQAYASLAASGPRTAWGEARLLQLRQAIGLSQQRLSTLLERLDSITLAREERANSLSVVESAVPPKGPSNRHFLRNVALALLVGLLVGTGVAYSAERIRPRLHGGLDAEATAGAPILANVPYVKSNHGGPGLNGAASTEEAFRRLRLAIFAGETPRKQRHAFVITSPERGDGKTTVTANLGLAFAQAGNRVVLVDADLRQPALHGHFRQPGEPGLRDVLEGEPTAEAIRETDTPNLSLIPAGSPSDQAGQLLEAGDWAGILKILRAEYDVVLVDGPPILDVSDPLVLAAPSDGVLLVLRNASVPRDLLEQAQDEVEAAGGEVFGLIVNRTGRQRKYADLWRS